MISEIYDIYSINEAIDAIKEEYFELNEYETQIFMDHYETIVYDEYGNEIAHIWYDEEYHTVVVTEY